MGSRGATLGDVMLAEIKARRLLAARRLARQLGYRIVDGKWIRRMPDDFATCIEEAPKRPSGTLTVTLEYAGRGTPSPVEAEMEPSSENGDTPDLCKE